MNNEIKTAVSLTFTTAELLVLLAEVNMPQAVGVDREAFEAQSDAVQQQALEEARRSLLARHMLSEAGEISEMAQAVLGSLLLAPKLITIAPLLARTNARPLYYYIGKAFHMIQLEEAADQHQFSLLANDNLLWDALRHALRPLLVGDGDYSTVTLPVQQFEAIGNVGLTAGAEAATAQLLAIGASADVAQALGATLASGVYTAVSLIDFPAGQAAAQELVLLHGAGQAWKIERSGERTVVIAPATLTAIEAQIQQFVLGR